MLDAATCRALNERRQALAVATLADEHAPIGSGVMAHTAGARWICKAVAADLEGPLSAGDIDAIVAWFRARDVDPVLEVTSLADEATLRVAADAGFVLAEVENVWAMTPRPLDAAPPEGITLRRVDTADDSEVRRFAEIVGSGFTPADEAVPEAVPEAVIESGVRSLHMGHFAGFLAVDADGTPLAASGTEILDIEPAAGASPARMLALCGTTVLPAYRRRGIQQALMAARLALGVERGCAVAVVESKPGIPTERNAARAGFGVCYTRLVLRAPRG